jgi:hypothetical protein
MRRGWDRLAAMAEGYTLAMQAYANQVVTGHG